MAPVDENEVPGTVRWAIYYDPELDPRQFLDWLQYNHSKWESVNFPADHQSSTEGYLRSLAGMIEELGELAHSVLKAAQGIRMDENHDAKGQDAVGDLFIYCAALCNKKGWNMQNCVEQAWTEVGMRNWTKNKDNGVDR